MILDESWSDFYKRGCGHGDKSECVSNETYAAFMSYQNYHKYEFPSQKLAI